MNKNYWKNFKLVREENPDILCPTCSKGTLVPNVDSLVSKETGESKTLHNYEDWDPDWITYRFTLTLNCNNSKCTDLVVCIGDGKEIYYEVYNKKRDDWEQAYIQHYYPKYFIPSLKIISIKDNYPEVLSKELDNSFSHFFSDLSACANKIRICVEILMDEFGINKTEIKNNKRKILPLHNRILIYKRQNTEIADYLLAIKWIGNSGSHKDNLTVDDILEAYQILDYTLNKIYDKKESEVKKLVKKINYKKAPLSKSRKKT